jgi:IrrE N-terminal-like domain
MRWTADVTGRFPERPYYDAEELDDICERIITHFLLEQHGVVRFPLTTDDLLLLIEQMVTELDIYANLSSDGPGIDGVTDFAIGLKPSIRIAVRLAENPAWLNRFRTTLTHELAHALFHDLVVQRFLSSPSATRRSVTIRSHRDAMLGRTGSDWMEWQAGYASCAFLMPRSCLRERVRMIVIDGDEGQCDIHPKSKVGQGLIRYIQAAFQVSEDAARVRLLRRHYLTVRSLSGVLP